MAAGPYLLDRIWNVLSSKNIQWTEKRMFGGDCFRWMIRCASALIKAG